MTIHLMLLQAFVLKKHFALPVLRSPARRDEGWMRSAQVVKGGEKE
jgi:hypothetical protein